MLKQHKTIQYYALIIVLLCSSFQFYKYVLQVYPSIITDQLMREFQLTGAGLGNLAATFYYSYMITQLFVGVILDRFSARWITTGAIFCCALGLIFFTQAHDIYLAGFARALMGIGVAFSTVVYIKLTTMYTAPRYQAFVAGLLATATMAGAVFGQIPLNYVIQHLSWRTALTLVAFFGFALSFLFAAFLTKRSGELKIASEKVSINILINLFKQKQNWLLACYGGLAFAPVSVFGGLWGHPFLRQAYQLTEVQASWMISMIFIGLGIGSPLIGILASRVNNLRGIMTYCTIISALSLSCVLYCSSLPLYLMLTIFIC